MENKFTIAFVGILLVAGIAFSFLHQSTPGTTGYITIQIVTPNATHSFHVFLADDEQERATGLMWIKNMDKDKGMLFVFDTQDIKTFWMKNTKIPLDMIFIDSNKKIVSIQKNVQPCTSKPCPTYPSKLPAMYVLEINSNLSEEKNINIGDHVDIQV